jgi:hypothetical protein
MPSAAVIVETNTTIGQISAKRISWVHNINRNGAHRNAVAHFARPGRPSAAGLEWHPASSAAADRGN